MKNTITIQREEDFVIQATEGYVITNYQDGDERYYYSKELIYKDILPDGFYTVEEAKAIKMSNEINPQEDYSLITYELSEDDENILDEDYELIDTGTTIN